MTDNITQMWLDCFNDGTDRGPMRVCEILDMNYDIEGVSEILRDLDSINQEQEGINDFRDFLEWYIEDAEEIN